MTVAMLSPSTRHSRTCPAGALTAILIPACGLKSCRKMFQRAHDRIRREAAQRAERAEFHGVAEVFDDRDILSNAIASTNLVDGLDSAGRADPARRAFAAGFDGAEFHREARLLRHVDAVVEHDDAAVSDQPVAFGEGFIVERRVEQLPRESKRRAGRRPAPREPGVPVKVPPPISSTSSPSVTPNAVLEQAAIFDVAGELDRHRPARAAHAEIGVRLGATGEDERDRRERQHVIDHGRLAEQIPYARAAAAWPGRCRGGLRDFPSSEVSSPQT